MTYFGMRMNNKNKPKIFLTCNKKKFHAKINEKSSIIINKSMTKMKKMVTFKDELEIHKYLGLGSSSIVWRLKWRESNRERIDNMIKPKPMLFQTKLKSTIGKH